MRVEGPHEDEPYFTVLTDPKFLRTNLTDETRREFFAGGEALVDFMWRTIQLRLSPDFGPTAILEYGCGAGRLALPLARRAARRAGVVTAVDRSPAMLRTAQFEAESQGVQNIVFCEPDELFAQTNRFDFLVCYLVLQRMPPRDGLALVRRLIERIVPGGIGVFQFPYRTEASALVSGSRWLREHVPGANAVVNTLRGQAGSQPFTPTHTYRTEDVLKIFDATDAPAAYLTLEDHGDVASVIAMTERPMSAPRKPALSELVLRQAQDERVERPRAPAVSDGTRADSLSDGTRRLRADGASASLAPEAIDVKDLIASTSIDDLNAAAEQYFASLTNWDHHLAKPFSGVDEAPWLLTHFTVVLEALRLKPGLTVLEFGAGTGWASRFLTQLGCRVILLDVSATALRIAEELYARVPVIGDQPAPEFLVFDGRRIDLPDASVDRVMCLHAFHHVPNPAEMIAEFGRILRPGGRAAFAEPGPTHSRAAQSQFEMRSYRVVENDVDVHELWRIARGCGFADLQMMVFHGLPFHVTLDRFEDFLRGGETCAEWVADARVFLRNIRNFVLVKEGTERSDSRSSAGLTCEIDARLGEPAREGSPIAVRVIATNVGEAIWLPRTADIGGVSLGFHVFDESGALLRTEVLSNALREGFHEVAPGEMATLTVALPPLPKGRYVVEIDCVADRVGWFAQLGSRPARVEVVVS
jgi:ubiquinone/menaquinone biosynthesis C-methylase UbiE